MSPASTKAAPAGAPPGVDRRLRRVAFVVLLVLLPVLAWVQDDAFITFRTVDNLLDGHGLRWNPAERVQVFTHPLWLLLHVPLVALTGEVYLTTMALSALLGGLTVWLIAFRVAPTPRLGWLALLALLLSRSWIDWTSSGLENPLTRLLLTALALALLGDPTRRLLRCGLLASAGALCRPDAFLLFLPALVDSCRQAPRGRRPLTLLVALAPLLAWGAFATFYFGSPLPNTALAKLGGGVPWAGRLTQGVVFLGVSALRDPWTLLVTVGGALWVLRGRSPLRPLAWGSLCFLPYLVWMGGDYTLGRFLDGAFLGVLLALLHDPRAGALAARASRRTAVRWAAAAAACAAIQAVGVAVFRDIDPLGIADERRVYAPFTGLLPGLVTRLVEPDRPWPDHDWRADGLAAGRAAATGRPRIAIDEGVGMLGYYAGPAAYIVDTNALTDPFLARLPARVPSAFVAPGRRRRGWRPGHLARALPAGYLETLEAGEPRFPDPALAELWRDVELAHRAPLLAPGRARAILGLTLHRYRPALRDYVARHPDDFGVARP
jgi:arabinofuranosyltransferase